MLKKYPQLVNSLSKTWRCFSLENNSIANFFTKILTKVLLPIHSDAQILLLIKSLDKQAISAILDQYGDTLYGIAYHKLQSEPIAAEVVQQTFVAAWRKLSNFDEHQDRIFNWTLKIMKEIIAENYFEKAA